MPVKQRFPFPFLGILLLTLISGAQESETLVTTLGNDTLAIEQWTRQPGNVQAEVLIRSPRVTFSRQQLLQNADGSLQAFRSSTYSAGDLAGEPLEEETAIVVADSLLIASRKDTLDSRMAYAYEPGLLPWYDMVHWPYEVALRQMKASGETARDQKMISGREPGVFEFRKIADDSVSIRHPYRGTMYVRTTSEGGISLLDARATTRKLIVRRSDTMNMEELAAKYAGQPLGALSGEGATEARVRGARIRITYGRPAQRGRKLFGNIVPWGAPWRTGANKATHLLTDSPLTFGELRVPAGEYTLFTIPEPTGGSLIINTQTGQNGNNYDPSRDLGREEMTLRILENPVELFTIEVRELPNGSGLLMLEWGDASFEIPFEVGQ